MSKLETNQVDPATGTTLTLGTSGDTITIPSGVTIANSGTATGFGGTNTPAFHARLSSNQSISDATVTKVQFDTELFDTNNTYDNSTNYRFTPGVAGKYVLTSMVQIQNCGNESLYYVRIYKNGSTMSDAMAVFLPGRNDDLSGIITKMDIANTTDYYEIHTYTNGGSTVILPHNTFFNAHKIIE